MLPVPPFQILNSHGSLRVPSDTEQYQAPFLVRLAAFNANHGGIDTIPYRATFASFQAAIVRSNPVALRLAATDTQRKTKDSKPFAAWLWLLAWPAA